MSMFSAISIAQSGMGTYKAWIDATADNVANVNTLRRTSEPAYQARRIEVQSAPGGGIEVAAARFGSAAGRIVNQPGSPLADAQGNVRAPDMNLSDEMTSLIIA